MKIDLVCSGGGIKGIALLGAIHTLEQNGFSFVNIAGTSVGALIGSLICAGYSAKEILKSFQDNLPQLSFYPNRTSSNQLFRIYRWLKLYRSLGLYSSDGIEKLLAQLLKQKGISTFLDLPPNALRIVASDLTREEIVVFPKDCEIYKLDISRFKISDAVRMSATLPFYFRPNFLIHQESKQKCMIVDGGILSNFPMWLFTPEFEKKKRPVIGLQLQSESVYNFDRQSLNAFNLLKQLIQTMQTAHDRVYIRKSYAKDIIFISVGKVQATDFQLSQEQLNELFEIGVKSCEKFLYSWSY